MSNPTSRSIGPVLIATIVMSAACASQATETNSDSTVLVHTEETVLVDTVETLVEVFFDGPQFISIEELASTSDLVVTGRVGNPIAYLDDKGDPAEYKSAEEYTAIDGVPWSIYEFVITDTLVGSSSDSAILLAVLDHNRMVADEVAVITEGDELVVFLLKETERTAPGLVPKVGDLFTPLNGSNGVFFLDGTTATAASSIVLAASTEEAKAKELEYQEELAASISETGQEESTLDRPVLVLGLSALADSTRLADG